eukprot:GHVH01014007.1.p1 GENE.GHVH01014007.1~~GHVH01014007.1.p1  ORF type:complete len:354 (+),score=40.73 GHVH01014007.1:1340-2401(+)
MCEVFKMINILWYLFLISLASAMSKETGLFLFENAVPLIMVSYVIMTSISASIEKLTFNLQAHLHSSEQWFLSFFGQLAEQQFAMSANDKFSPWFSPLSVSEDTSSLCPSLSSTILSSSILFDVLIMCDKNDWYARANASLNTRQLFDVMTMSDNSIDWTEEVIVIDDKQMFNVLIMCDDAMDWEPSSHSSSVTPTIILFCAYTMCPLLDWTPAAPVETIKRHRTYALSLYGLLLIAIICAVLIYSRKAKSTSSTPVSGDMVYDTELKRFICGATEAERKIERERIIREDSSSLGPPPPPPSGPVKEPEYIIREGRKYPKCSILKTRPSNSGEGFSFMLPFAADQPPVSTEEE